MIPKAKTRSMEKSSNAALVERLVDEAMKVVMFDWQWDDESVPEVKLNRAAFRDAFKGVLLKWKRAC